MRQDILVADDDAMDRRMLRRALESSGFVVSEAISGREALAKIRNASPDLLILDLNLGDLSGLDVCAAIKSDDDVSDIPIIILTGNDETGKSAICLNQGADDYMVKPFDRVELTARINAVLRRVRYGGRRDAVVRRDGISVDAGRKAVLLEDRVVENLTPKEFELVRLLVRNSPNVVSRELLARSVWNSAAQSIHKRTIDVHIRRIRLKLGATAGKRLITLKGAGYKFV